MTAGHPYTLDDLKRIDERCLEISAGLGFDIPETVYHLVRPEEIYYAAANGLPARYSSSRWGATYDREYGSYQRGRGRIYELIFNTKPVHAYLMDGNSLTAQTLVIAHCHGHSFCFENNKWLNAVDRHIMPRVKAAAERIDGYMGEHGRDKVEDFIDACNAIAIHQPQAQLVKRGEPSEPEYEPSKYDDLFPAEVAAERARVEREREELRRRFPRHPEPDLLAFVEQHARGLEDWQRDIISIVRSEQSYFVPQMRTKILNEGLAVLVHQEVVQRLMLPSDQYWEYEQLNSSVVRPHPGDVNPYHLGIILLRSIIRIAEDPTDKEREKWAWAGDGNGLDHVRRVVRDYDDEALLREFLTPQVCEDAKLYAFEHQPGRRQIRVSSRECDKVREVLIPRHSTFGIPRVEIVDADYMSAGRLLLEHRHDDGPGLDREYAHGTLVQIASLWGKPVTVRTVTGDEKARRDIYFTGHPDGRTETADPDGPA